MPADTVPSVIPPRPKALRAKLLALLRKWGFDYECYCILGLSLRAAPPMTASALPGGYLFRELDPADIERSEDAAIRACGWYGGEESAGYAIIRRDGGLACLQWYWFGQRYARVSFWPVQPSDAVSIHLATLEGERGRGLATSLKQLSAAEMRGRGFTALYSRIWWTNVESLSVSRKAGWTRVGTTLRFRLPFVGSLPTFRWKHRAMPRNRLKDTIDALRSQGPLGTLWRILAKLRVALDRVPLVGGALLGATRGVAAFQQYLDRSYDRRHGTDTAGIIATKDLQIERGSRVLGNWYEPVSENIFNQIMRQIRVDARLYTCVDLGSGKGRGLLMAADYGFQRLVGVEFARDLHVIAEQNLAVHEARTGRPSGISVVCMDAQEYEIPPGNVFVFLYSPFTGTVMERVVNNIRASHRLAPRPMVIVFYGQNKESLEDLDSLGFAKREIPLRVDWTRLNMFRVWVYESSEAVLLRPTGA